MHGFLASLIHHPYKNSNRSLGELALLGNWTKMTDEATNNESKQIEDMCKHF